MNTINCIQRAVDFIEDNICDELSPEVISSQAYMSSFHFQRVFQFYAVFPLANTFAIVGWHSQELK